MAEPGGERLRAMAATVRAELPRIDQCAAEAATVARLLERSEPSGTAAEERVALYAAAAVLETYYTGVEKILRRIVADTGGLPSGASWHRDLLEVASLDIPRVRPPIVSRETVKALSEFLEFRHRFRNLYLFDLEVGPIQRLLARLRPIAEAVSDELKAFARDIDDIADQLEAPESPD